MADEVVGKAWYDLAAKTDQLEKRLKEAEGKIATSGKKSASEYQSHFDKAHAGVSAGFGKVAGALAAIGITVGIASVVRGLSDMAKAAMDDEESVNRLGASLRANDAAFDGNVDAIEANISAAQRLGFEDEVLRDSLTVLTGATHDVGRAQEIMSTAMDLARFKGIDLRTASEALIKVEGGHYRMLAQLGIKLDEGADSTEALAAVQAVAAGQAEAYADTTKGAWDAATIALGEAGEEIGTALLPIIKELAFFIRDELAPAITGFADFITNEMPAALDRFNVDLHEATGGMLGYSQAVADDKEQTRQWLANLEAAGAVLPGIGAAAGDGYAGELTEGMEDGRAGAEAIARRTPGDVARAIIAGQREVQDGVTLLTELMNDEWDDASRIAYLKGVLSSQQLADGLNHGDADVRSQAMFVRDNALRELARLESGAYDRGAAGSRGYATGIATPEQKRAATDAAIQVKGAAMAGLEPTGTAWTAGLNMTLTYLNGLKSQQAINAARAAAGLIAQTVSGYWIGDSPPRYGPLKDLDTDAQELGALWADNLGKGITDTWMPRLTVGTLRLGLEDTAGASALRSVTVTHVIEDPSGALAAVGGARQVGAALAEGLNASGVVAYLRHEAGIP